MELSESNIRSMRIAQMAATFHAACGIPMWVYDMQGNLCITTSSFQKELETFFAVGGCKEWIYTQADHIETPLIMSDFLGFLWVAEFIDDIPGLGKGIFMLGPIFNSALSMKVFENRLREHNLELNLRSMGNRILSQVAIVPMSQLIPYIHMLHFSVTEKVISEETFIYQTEPADPSSVETRKEMHYLDHEKNYALESIMLSCIQEGNLNYQKLIPPFFSNLPADNFMTKDPLRELIDTMIIFTAQCTAAAIEGGLAPKIAKEMQTEAIRRFELCHTITELSQVFQWTYDGYVRKVYSLHIQKDLSKQVQIACDYIKAHFLEPVTLADIAKAVCYSEYYLTRKFQKEMGMRLSDYLCETRLEYAKILLVSTEQSIQEISEQLHFCSRNYFSRIFKEHEGISPQDFRNRLL